MFSYFFKYPVFNNQGNTFQVLTQEFMREKRSGEINHRNKSNLIGIKTVSINMDALKIRI